VDARSYSRTSGRTSLERTTGASSSRSRISLARRSCAGVQVREEEADRDGLHAQSAQCRSQLRDALLVEGAEDVSRGVDALGDLKSEGPGHQGLGPVGEPVVELRPVLAADLQHIAEAFGGDEGRLRPAVFEEGVRGHGRAVDDPLDLTKGDPQALAQLMEAREHAEIRGPRRGDFQIDQTLGVYVEEDEVGERPAHVDADLHAHGGRSLSQTD
jgi:hypothetical protein